jgi:hypothetical protein
VFGRPPGIVTPLVLGPQVIPIITDPDRAQENPELTMLSTLAHAGGPDQRRVIEAVCSALDVIDRDDHGRADLYADVLFAELPAAAQDYLEECMTTTTGHRYRSEFARRYFGQGKAEGKAEDVLAVLDARGIEVRDELREHITSCTDLAQLDKWIRRAATVRTAQDLFD